MENQLIIICREVGDKTVILDLAGDLTRHGEGEMLKNYQQATARGSARLLYNFASISNINSSGIAILIGIVSEARKKQQKISVFGLNDHFHKVFHMIGLPKYIDIFSDEKQALGVDTGGAQ